MHHNIKYLLLPLLFTLTHSLSFFSTINDVTISILLPAEFECWVLHNTPIVVTWTHKTNTFTCNDPCIPSIQGYSFASGISQTATLYRMTIDSVALSDSGSVTCKATLLSDGSFILSTATLTVRDVTDFLQIPVTQIRNLGGTVIFDCLVNKGGGNFVWKRGDLVLNSNLRYTIDSFAANSSLSITGLTAVDIAEYTCEYSLSGDVINSSANLILLDYIAPYILTGSVQVNLIFGPTTVACPVEGNPIPTDITWYHNGIQVPTSTNQGPYSTAGILQFDLSSESDTGDYICTASNGIDIANGTVSVMVIAITGVLTRWYVIMGLCVAILSVSCVGCAFILSLVCCCYDRRNERKLEEKYRNRIKQIKTRRTQRSIAAKQQSERTKATHISVNREGNNQQLRRFTHPPNINLAGQYSERSTNPDGSVTYSAKRETVQVNIGPARRPNTVAEIYPVMA